MHINPIYINISKNSRNQMCDYVLFYLPTIKICNFLVYSRERIIKKSKGEKFRQGTKFVLGF